METNNGWQVADSPAPRVLTEMKDQIALTPHAAVHIIYAPYAMTYLSVSLPYSAIKQLSADRRDESRAAVIEALVPLVEEAFAALQAVRENQS